MSVVVFKPDTWISKSFLGVVHSTGLVFCAFSQLYCLFYCLIMSDEEDGSTTAPTADMAAILKDIRESQKKLSDKFVHFQEEVKRGQEDAATKALKRVRREKSYVYRRKGNEEQALFNEKIVSIDTNLLVSITATEMLLTPT